MTFMITSEHLLSLAVFLLLSLIAVFKYLFRRFDNDVKDLKDKYAGLNQTTIRRTEFDQTIRMVRDEIARGNRETHKRLDQLIFKLREEV